MKHGLYKTRLYHLWANMKYRCSYKDSTHAKNYVSRGITVCDEWKKDFMEFYRWAIANGYKENLTIDRIDVNKGYSPENCRWADMVMQNNNRRDNAFIEYDGKTLTRRQWARELGISPTALDKRIIEYNWTIKRAFTEPVKKKRLREPTLCIKNDVVIGEYESASEAARSVGGRPNGVIMCCRGQRKTYRGFVWRYKNG
jgi:hypothetical protein